MCSPLYREEKHTPSPDFDWLRSSPLAVLSYISLLFLVISCVFVSAADCLCESLLKLSGHCLVCVGQEIASHMYSAVAGLIYSSAVEKERETDAGRDREVNRGLDAPSGSEGECVCG